MPVLVVSVTVFRTIIGGFYYQEFDDLDEHTSIFFLFIMLTIAVACIVIANKRK